MLADAEHLEADLVGQFDLFDQIAQPLRRREHAARRRVRRVLDEGVDADFHVLSLVRVAETLVCVGSACRVATGCRFIAGEGSAAIL